MIHLIARDMICFKSVRVYFCWDVTIMNYYVANCNTVQIWSWCTPAIFVLFNMNNSGRKCDRRAVVVHVLFPIYQRKLILLPDVIKTGLYNSDCIIEKRTWISFETAIMISGSRIGSLKQRVLTVL